MRSSMLPRRPLRRVCDACKQHQRNHAPSRSFSRATPVNTDVAPSRVSIFPSRQTTGLGAVACRTQIGNCSSSTSVSTQTRHLSSSSSVAASARGEARAESNTTAEESSKAKGEKKARTHYDLFPQTLPQGPPPHGPFAVDPRALRREFLTLQATAHPDLAPAGPERRRAEAASAHINEAYRTLVEALPRAQYLLRLRGLDVANEETARVDDPELLMVVLEAREAIEEAQSEEELNPLWQENQERIEECEKRLAEALERDDLDEARLDVTRLRYWVNIKDSIKNWERGKPVVLEH